MINKISKVLYHENRINEILYNYYEMNKSIQNEYSFILLESDTLKLNVLIKLLEEDYPKHFNTEIYTEKIKEKQLKHFKKSLKDRSYSKYSTIS